MKKKPTDLKSFLQNCKHSTAFNLSAHNFSTQTKSVQFHSVSKSAAKKVLVERNRVNEQNRVKFVCNPKTEELRILPRQAVALILIFFACDCVCTSTTEHNKTKTRSPIDHMVYVCLCIVRNCQLNYMKMSSCFLFPLFISTLISSLRMS